MRFQILKFSFALAIIAVSATSLLATQTPPVTSAPEIDGNTLAAGLGLLASGALIVRSRWHRK